MAKSNLNRGAFGRASSAPTQEVEPEVLSSKSADVPSAAELSIVPEPPPAPKVAPVVSTSKSAPDDRQDLLNKIEALEARVKLLEDKLQALVTILSREMSGGLRGGPESLGRALRAAEILKS